MLTEVTGRAKAAGKTTLLMGLIRSVTEGRPFLDRPTSRGPVVLLTEERPATLRIALNRAGISGSDVHILSRGACGAMAWREIATAAVERCLAVGAVLLIVDTISPFAGLAGDRENNAGDALDAVAPLQAAVTRNLAVVLVRHERKGGGDVGEAGRGSTAFTGAVDITASLQRLPGANDRRRVLRISGRPDTPDAVTIELTDTGYVLRSEGEFSAVADASEALLKALATRPGATEADLSQVVAPIPRTTVRSSLEGLRSTGVVVRLGEGKKGSPYRFQLHSDEAPIPRASETNHAGRKTAMASNRDIVPP
jgi:hypothetical protein